MLDCLACLHTSEAQGLTVEPGLWHVQVTQLEQNMNFLVGTMFLVQLLISVLCALGQNAFNTNYLRQMWYVTAPM